LQEDPRFADGDARRADPEGLYQALATYFHRLTLEETKAVLTEAGIPAAILTAVGELAEDPQALAAGILTPVADPRPGWTHTVNSPIAIEGAEKVAPRYAPALGEHSAAILGELGFDAATVSALQARGVLGGA
jgi:formyl-CoA transferase